MAATVQLPLLQTHPLVPPPELTALQSTGAIHRVHTGRRRGVAGHRLPAGPQADGRRSSRPLAPRPRQCAAQQDLGTVRRPDRRIRHRAGRPRPDAKAVAATLLPQTHAHAAPKVEGQCAALLDAMRPAGAASRPAHRPGPTAAGAGDLRPARRALRRPGQLPACGSTMPPSPPTTPSRRRAWRRCSTTGWNSSPTNGHIPDDDVISRLCDEPDLADPEIAMLAMQLLFAGHETTMMQIWLDSVLLLTNPDQWQLLRERPDLIPKAVEELIRTGMPGGIGVPRYASEDIDVDGRDDPGGRSRATGSRIGQSRSGGVPRPLSPRYPPDRNLARRIRVRPALLRRCGAGPDGTQYRLLPADSAISDTCASTSMPRR